jgi:hypothetical protein
MGEIRDIKNYPFKSYDIIDAFSGDAVSYKAVPMRFSLNKGNGSLEVEVHKSAKDFNNYADKSPNLSKNLPINADVIKSYSSLFELIEQKGLEFLEVKSEDFYLELLEIDLRLLKIRLTARHKIKQNRFSSDETANAEEFENLKKTYPEITQAFVMFAFEYMATNEQLAQFK